MAMLRDCSNVHNFRPLQLLLYIINVTVYCYNWNSLQWLRLSTGCNLHELMCLAVQCLHATQSVSCSNCNNIQWLRLSTGRGLHLYVMIQTVAPYVHNFRPLQLFLWIIHVTVYCYNWNSLHHRHHHLRLLIFVIRNLVQCHNVKPEVSSSFYITSVLKSLYQ